MTAWTPAQVLEAYTRHHNGATRGEIAREMGKTRNAVIGYFGRHPPPPREAPAALPLPVVAAQQVPLPPPTPPPAPVLRPPPLEPRPTKQSISQFRERATNPCRWPFGDPATDGFRFCGDAAHGGKPYCPVHEEIAHPPPQPKRSHHGKIH